MKIDGKNLTDAERIFWLAKHRNEDELLSSDPEPFDPVHWNDNHVRSYPPPVENPAQLDADDEFDKMLETQSMLAYSTTPAPLFYLRELVSILLGAALFALLIMGIAGVNPLELFR